MAYSMDDVPALKAALRDATRRALDLWPESARLTSDYALFTALLEDSCIPAATRILLFYGVGTEPQTAPLLPALWALGKTVCLPRCLPGRRMEARVILPGAQMETSAFGIPEPSESCPLVERDELDLILVPALCYDWEGYRLGQGGGYYDRYLNGYAGQTVGLCRKPFLQERLPREAHDLPVSRIFTEDGPLPRGYSQRT